MPFSVGEAQSPSNTMWPGPMPTSVPSGILIHPTFWPQYTNVTDRTVRADRTGRRSDSIGPTVLQSVVQWWCFVVLLSSDMNFESRCKLQDADVAECCFRVADNRSTFGRLLQKVLQYFSYSVMPRILQYFFTKYCYCYSHSS